MAEKFPLILPIIGNYIRKGNYFLFIPKLSKNLFNVHLINEVNLYSMFDEVQADICKKRFCVDYFHLFNIKIYGPYYFKLFNIFGDFQEKDIYNFDILGLSNNFQRRIDIQFNRNIIVLIRNFIMNQLIIPEYVNRDEIIRDYDQYFAVIQSIMNPLVGHPIIPENLRLDLQYTNHQIYDYIGHVNSKINVVRPYFIKGFDKLENLPDLNPSTLTDTRSTLVIMGMKHNPILLSKDYINPRKTEDHNKNMLYILILIMKRYELIINNENKETLKKLNKLIIQINIQFKEFYNNIIRNVPEDIRIYTNKLTGNRNSFRFSQQIIKMFYEYVYSEKKILHVSGTYFTDPLENNYLVGIGGVNFNLANYPGISGTTISVASIDKSKNLHENILLKEEKVNTSTNLKENLANNIHNILHIYNRKSLGETGLQILSYVGHPYSIIEILTTRDEEYKYFNIINIFDNLQLFCRLWTEILDEIDRNTVEDPYITSRNKLQFAKEIIKIVIFCSGYSFFNKHADITEILVKTSGGSLGLGIDLLSRTSIDLSNLNNIIEYIFTKNINNINNIIDYTGLNDEQKREKENKIIYIMIYTFLTLYKTDITQDEKTEMGDKAPQQLIFQELLLKPICNIIGNDNLYNCIRANKYVVNKDFADSLYEVYQQKPGVLRDEQETYYKNLFYPDSITLDIQPGNKEKICFIKAPAKIRIFVFIGKYDNNYFSIIPEIANFEYLMPIKEENLFKKVNVNQIGGYYSFTPSLHRFISNNLGSIDGFWSKHIMNPRFSIDSPDTNLCMNDKIYPEFKKLIKLLSPTLLELNMHTINGRKNCVGRYAIDILYKENDENCKLKVIDINSLGALMDFRAGYDTLLLLLKMSLNDNFYDETTVFQSEEQIIINGRPYNSKIFEKKTNELYIFEEDSEFSKQLKVTNYTADESRKYQRFTIAFFENINVPEAAAAPPEVQIQRAISEETDADRKLLLESHQKLTNIAEISTRARAIAEGTVGEITRIKAEVDRTIQYITELTDEAKTIGERISLSKLAFLRGVLSENSAEQITNGKFIIENQDILLIILQTILDEEVKVSKLEIDGDDVGDIVNNARVDIKQGYIEVKKILETNYEIERRFEEKDIREDIREDILENVRGNIRTIRTLSGQMKTDWEESSKSIKIHSEIRKIAKDLSEETRVLIELGEKVKSDVVFVKSILAENQKLEESRVAGDEAHLVHQVEQTRKEEIIRILEVEYRYRQKMELEKERLAEKKRKYDDEYGELETARAAGKRTRTTESLEKKDSLDKYLKYKLKYLELKKKLNIN